MNENKQTALISPRPANGITHTNKDVLFKVLTQNYQNKSLAVYGLDVPKIKQMLPSEYPVVSTKFYGDNMFLLEDDWLLCLEYESDVSWLDFLKYSRYVTNTLERLHKDGVRVRKVVIAVLYTADIKEADGELDLGDFHIKVQQVFLSKFDTNSMYAEIKAKIDAGVALLDEDIMRLIILPLTQPDKKRKQQLIENTVALIKRVQDDDQQAFMLAGILTATNKFIDPMYAEKVKEWLKMTKVARLLIDEAMEERSVEIARKMLADDESLLRIMKYTDLTREEVEQLQLELGLASA